MSDFISENNTTIDTYVEHDLHTEYNQYCSTCYAISCGKGTLYPETCDFFKTNWENLALGKHLTQVSRDENKEDYTKVVINNPRA